MIFNALSVIAALLIVARIAWRLDTQDIVVEWTPEGKKLTLQILTIECFYANEIVDKSYARPGITDDTRSHNRADLTCQEREYSY